jgi:murein DD-endopeptidase MepM/ murein hydrolase activator NlpD
MKIFLRECSGLLAICCAFLLLPVSQSASANSAANAASAANSATNAGAADIVEPLREAQGEGVSASDQRFRALFSSWVALDRAGGPLNNPAERSVVSIPSRMPLIGSVLTSGYGMRSHPVLGGLRKHTGIDLAAPTGTPVYATADGVVSRADWYSSYGLYISVEHGASLQTRYAHLSRLAVATGDVVKKGDLIGYVGSTGRSTGPHLHYEVRVDGLAVNPIPYMMADERRFAATQSSELTGAGGE